MRLTLTLVLLSTAVPAVAAERSFSVAPFDRIDLRGATNVEVTTGRAISVRAVGDQSELDRLEIASHNGEISIATKPRMWSMGWSKPVTVYVTVPALIAARLTGSGDLSIDRVAGAGFDGNLTGSGDLRLRTVDVAQLRLALQGSGDIYAAGRCRTGTYELRGSGDLRADGLSCQSLIASLRGSGDINGRATATADLNLTGSGDIRVAGGARCTRTKRGSGDISCG